MKSEFRKSAQSQRAQLQIPELSLRIQQLLIESPVFQSAQRIATYVPLGSEIDVFALIPEHSQKEWFLPKVISPEHIGLFPYRHGDPLHRHQYGMLEPEGQTPTDPTTLDLILVPGLMFDHQGYRLGYGKGYYDRLLCNLPKEKTLTCGVLPEALLTADLPHDEWDHPVSALLTESALRKI